jgi:hypothetical protein
MAQTIGARDGYAGHRVERIDLNRLRHAHGQLKSGLVNRPTVVNSIVAFRFARSERYLTLRFGDEKRRFRLRD